MKKQKNPKSRCIIDILSVHQTITKPHFLPYATSKAGIEMMTKTMALELAKDNIRANIVAPGAIYTDMNIELRKNKTELQNVLKRIPMGRVASAEVANVVEFLALDKGSYVRDAVYFVDVRMTLYPSFDITSEHHDVVETQK